MDYTQLLFEKYGTVLLETKDVSTIIGRSVHSLEADRRAGEGIQFKRLGTATNSPVRYPIGEVSKWINQVDRIA